MFSHRCRMYGHHTSTYESGSHRFFQHGRTETIRSCTVESVAFCEAMEADDVDVKEKIRLYKEAETVHKMLSQWVRGVPHIEGC